jgi:hypothetical protein
MSRRTSIFRVYMFFRWRWSHLRKFYKDHYKDALYPRLTQNSKDLRGPEKSINSSSMKQNWSLFPGHSTDPSLAIDVMAKNQSGTCSAHAHATYARPGCHADLRSFHEFGVPRTLLHILDFELLKCQFLQSEIPSCVAYIATFPMDLANRLVFATNPWNVAKS